jgi:lysophospholipase L1-like esterase
VALALLCAMLAGGCGGESVRVLLLGDSITAGAVSGASDLAYPQRRGGGRRCGERDVSPDLYHAVALPELPVDVSVVLLGSNDAHGFLEREPISLEEYAENLRAIARALLRDGSGRVLLMSAPPTYHRIKRYRRLMSLRAQVERVCASEPRVACGPNLFDLLAPEDFEPQNLHPNAQGHERIAQALAAALRDLGREES